MNIVFLVVNLGCGGVERTVSYLSRYFAEHGHTTSIICISGEVFYNIDEKVNLINLNISSTIKGRVDRYKKILLRMMKTNKAVKQTKPDCLVCLDAEMIRYVGFQHKFGRFKLLTSERTNPLMHSEKQRLSKFKSYRKSDGIVFQSERARLCFPSDIASKGIVIPNAVGNELVFQAVAPTERRKAITAVGRLRDQKDYPTLIRAFALVRQRHPEFVLEIFGEGLDEADLIKMTNDMGLQDSVLFKGVAKDAVLHVASSACYVLSSIYEGMPNSLMEALAVGTPSVSTDCAFGPSELIRNGENGILVPVGDVDALADAICKMIEDKEFAERCSKESKKILDEQSIEKISQKYLDYIISIVEKSGEACEGGNL